MDNREGGVLEFTISSAQLSAGNIDYGMITEVIMSFILVSHLQWCAEIKKQAYSV